jgi:ATP-dependent Clp protease, protease subunit
MPQSFYPVGVTKAVSCSSCQFNNKDFIMETPNPNPSPPVSAPESRTSWLEEKTFKSRTLQVFGTVTDFMAADIARRLIALDAESAEPIDILVSSPGGHLESGDAIHDIVRYIAAPVSMIGTGWVGSAATHLYLAAPRERRFCTPNTRFLIHQPSGGSGGSASDIAIQAREIVKARERIASTIARETGKSLEVVLADIERDRWLSAEEAVEYGLVSRIIERKTELRGRV